MALGVLNNLSAIYAENNLNNTNSSLQTVLQQLSSGSKINSGADDAAGLSLVNGLQANSTALTQSETNATEGVGLLDVADGALSQVTNLLNRAVTLATEAANGTLNSTQESAANQEYQSILAEVNNIGSTTTYNQEQVFSGNTVAIYTGDSSTAGSSVDDLNIRALSSSSVGDSDGVMSYNSGQNNVFLDLSRGGVNAGLNDSLNAGGSTTLAINYLTQGSNGSTTTATANITVGTGTNYANTAQGLISAMNNAGLGLNGSFDTASEAGTGAVSAAEAANATGGGGTDTGIEISGTGVGTGTNGVGAIGQLKVNAGLDTLGGTLNIVGSDGKTHAIALGTANSTDTIANLAATINSAGYGVTASVDSTGKILTFMSANSAVSVSGTSITDGVHAASAVTVAPVAILAGAGGSIGTIATTNATDLLTGAITIDGVNGTNKTFTLGVEGSTDTIDDLASTINAFEADNGTNFGVTAAVAANKTITLTANASGGDVPSLSAGTGNFAPAAFVAAYTATADSLTGTVSATGAATSTTLATITGAPIANGALTLGANTLAVTSGETYTTLAAAINAGNYGVAATLNSAGTVMTLTVANPACMVRRFVASEK
jgi:flagellin